MLGVEIEYRRSTTCQPRRLGPLRSTPSRPECAWCALLKFSSGGAISEVYLKNLNFRYVRAFSDSPLSCSYRSITQSAVERLVLLNGSI